MTASSGRAQDGPGGEGPTTWNQVVGGIQYAVVQGQNVTVTLPPRIDPHLSGLPAVEETFTGRDGELRALLAALDPERERPAARSVSAVAGLPGVGKTELVLHAARQALGTEGWFPGGVLFVDLAGYDDERRVTPEKALDGFLRALGLPVEHIPHELQDLRRHYTSVLAAYAAQGRRILVVIDNASSAAQVEPLLPGDAATAVLVTSRHTLPGLGARLHDLDVLTPEAAVDVLRRALDTARGSADTRIDDEPAQARLVAERCGRLPLALQITAALLAERTDRALAAFAEDLVDTRSRLDELAIQDDEESPDWAVRSAFALSYGRLTDEQARLFALLSLNAGPDVSTEAATELAGREPRTVRRTLEALFRAHLLARGSAGDRWRMHDLVRLYAYERVWTGDRADVSAAVGRLWEYYRSHAEAASGAVGSRAGAVPPGRFADRNAAWAWLERERPNLLGAVALAAELGQPAAVARLTWAVSLHLHRSRRLKEALSASVLLLTVAQESESPDLAAEAHELVGFTLLDLSRYEEAAAQYQQAWSIRRAQGDRRGEARTLDQLGVALRKVEGGAEDSELWFAQSLAIFRELGDRAGEAQCLLHLGLARHGERRLEEAVELLERAAELFAASGNPDRRQTAVLAMADARYGLRQHAASLGHYEESIAYFRSVGERYEEATALEHLAIALVTMERTAEAEERLREAIALRRGLHEVPALAEALSRLAGVLVQTGRFADAEPVLRELHGIHRDLGDRAGERWALVRLQVVLSAVERTGEAIEVGLAAARIAAEPAGPVGTRETAAARFILALELDTAQRWAEAAEMYEESAGLYRESGDELGEALGSAGLGESLLRLEEAERAVPALERAVELYRSGGERTAEARALNMLAAALHESDARREDEARWALRRAAELFREAGDADGLARAEGNLERLAR